MTPLTLLVLIAGLGLIGWLFARAKAQQLNTGRNALHSLPGHHGWYLALWIVLPALVRGLAVHSDRTAALMQQCSAGRRGRASSMLGGLEEQRQVGELQAQCDALTARYVAFVDLVRTVKQNIPPSCSDLFKPSTMKKVQSLCHFPTNLMMHRVILKVEGGAERALSTVTFGAPSAHALGFKHGGLRSVFAKLHSEVLALQAGAVGGGAAGGPPRQPNRSPEARLRYLELRLAARAREGAVLAQALGAVASCAASAATGGSSSSSSS